MQIGRILKSAALALLLSSISLNLRAATFTVTTFSDAAPTAPGSVPGTGLGTAGDLRAAILAANTAGGSNSIVFSCVSSPCMIMLGGPLPPITSNLSIDGGTLGSVIIDGASTWRVFFVDTGTVTLSNLQIQNARAKGGNGGVGRLGCGGGGAGLGGGLFVNGITAAANVTLVNTFFLNDSAIGGDGCFTNDGNRGDGGGGGGLGANGGNGSLVTTGPNTGTYVNGGGGGVLGPGEDGLTNSIDGVAGGLGGGGGTDKNGSPSAAAGTGGVAYATNSPGSDGTAGSGGNGGFGGGGGAAVSGGGNGGFGGGGSGAEGFGGSGGPGGGGGGDLISHTGTGGVLVGTVRGGAPSGNGSGSGGGAAAGPDIFVNQGTLVVATSYTSGANAAGGAAGTGATPGTSDSTAVFNYAGSVNGSLAKGPVNVLGALAAPSISSAFSPDTVEVGGFSVLTFTVLNPNPVPLSNITFSNTVPAGVSEITQTGGTCSTLATAGGSFSINPGAGTFSSSSSSLPSLASCTISIRVQGTITGSKIDTSSTVTSDLTAAGTAASATLTVNADQPPALAAAFGAATVNEGDSTSLTFTLTNPNVTADLTNVAFSNTLPSGISIATPNGLSSTCGGSPTATAGASSMSIAGVTLAAGASCTFAVNIATTSSGVKVNTTSAITSDQATGATASATLTVNGVATHFSVGAPGSATVGTAFSYTVTALDAGNATFTNYSGTVHFTSSDGSAVLPADATLVNGVGTFSATLNTAGGQTITASSSLPVFSTTSGSITAGKRTQTITFGGLPVHTYGDAAFSLTGTSDSGLGIAYSVTSGPCGVAGATLTITASGTCVIAADQAGDGTYLTATTVPQSLTVNKKALTVRANDISITAGLSVPPLTASYSGFANGDTGAVLAGSPALSTTAPALPAAGTYPITVTAGTLAAANYTFALANGTLTVNTPPVPFSADPWFLNLTVVQGTTPQTHDFVVNSPTPGAPFSVSVAPASAAWLAAPATGTQGGIYKVTVDVSGLALGSYKATLTFTSSTDSFPVSVYLTVVPPSSIANAASFASATAAPNTILSIFGGRLGCSPAAQVLVDGVSAEVLYSGSTQVNFVLPNSIPPAGNSTIQVTCAGLVVLSTKTIPQSSANPAIFTQSATGTGQGSIVNQNGSINTAANPAVRGSFISVYGTGFGSLNPAGPDGLRHLASPVTATIGGLDANVVYAGEAPSETLGLQQINIQVPAGVTPGSDLPVFLTADGISTQAGVTVAVQ